MDNVYNDTWLKDEFVYRYGKIKESVEKLHADYEKDSQLKWFTPHGPAHYKIVENRLKDLIPKTYLNKLSNSERFFLIASAWIHDIGMIKNIFPDDNNLSDDEIRETHNMRTEKFIVEKYNFVNIEETEAEVFGIIARFHRRRTAISQCPESVDLMGHGKIRVRLLSAYLRLADALHVDQSRVPSNQYAITLAYNIPMNSKLHWLRSMFVIGLSIDIKNKEIVVQLKYPNDIEKWGIKENVIDNTLNSIYEVIVQDLIDELATVKEVLFYAGITYILSVRKEVIAVEFDQQLIRDIKTILNYYFLMDNPSSSALCRLVIESIQGIIEANSTGTRLNEDSLIIAISDFIKEIEKEILGSRKCHTGLRELVNSIDGYVNPQKINFLKDWINNYQLDLNAKRNGVRKNAKMFFINYMQNNESKFQSDQKIDILLYGYSELVIKSLCGFRDVIINKLLQKYQSNNNEHRNFHQIDFEKEAGNSFRIFVCEGQPKNKTAWGGRIIYHDGYRYALSLAERNFNNICLISDAVAGTLISPQNKNPNFPAIDFIMMGANGFNDKEFKHSAGHRIIAASKFAFSNCNDAPKLLLALLTSKFDNDAMHECTEPFIPDTFNISLVDGWPFHLSYAGEPTRNNIFMSQDPKIRQSLEERRLSISIYNPREDIIPIDWVDVVISENAWIENKNDSKWGGRYIVDCKNAE